MDSVIILAYFATGILAGTLSGLLGIGGGIVVVPALAAIFLHHSHIPESIYMKMAIGTSLAIMVITLASSVYAHHKRKSVKWHLVKRIAPGLCLGVFLGAFLVDYFSSQYLSIFFGIFLLINGLQMFFKKNIQETLSPEKKFKTPSLTFFSFVIGILSSLLGAGGGVIWVPYFLHHQITIYESVGTSLACGILAASIATVCFILTSFLHETSHGISYIYWPAFVCVALMSVLFAPLGTMLGARLNANILRKIFAVCLLFVAMDMLFVG